MGRKIPMWQVLLVMVVMLVLLFFEIMQGSGDAHIALVLSAIIGAAIAVLNGWKWSFIEKGILAAIDRSMQACLILMVVGMMIGAWISGGVVPAMI